MAYKLTQSDSILRKADSAIVPIDFRNVDYQEYQRWLEEGNVTEPADPPPQPSKEERIAARLQSAGFPTKGHLVYFIENMRVVASLRLGITEEQAHTLGMAQNPMYQDMVTALGEIEDIEREP